MKEKKILFYCIIAFIILTIIQEIIIIGTIDSIPERKITAKAAYGRAILCMDLPPVINNTCNNTADEYTPYFCIINATDPDGDNINFSAEFLGNYTPFNLTHEGIINFTPPLRTFGNFTYVVEIYDIACGEYHIHNNFTFEIKDINLPPVLIEPIPNQTWNQDTSLKAFDLDKYFEDLDYDTLTYSWHTLHDIDISIDNENWITFTPLNRWYGEATISFTAIDPYGLNLTSNTVYLKVLSTHIPEEPDPVMPGGNGGGSASPPSCVPEWYCKPWGECQPDNTQSRTCIDKKNCSSNYNKPDEVQPCNFIHTCYDGILGPEEEQIDCGGICPPCPSCFDGIKNQDEEGIDCGGICSPCKTTQNNKTEEKKENIEIPGIIDDDANNILPSIIIGIIIAAVIGYLIYMNAPLIRSKITPLILKKKKEPALPPKEKATILENLAKIETRITRSKTRTPLMASYSAQVRQYFKSLLGLTHELTYDELIIKIQQSNFPVETKKILKTFLKKSIDLEFSGAKITKIEMQSLINEFRDIITLTSLPSGFDENSETKDLPSKAKIDKILMKISIAENSLKNNNINKAYELYLTILKDFEGLEPESKKRVKDYITRLYTEIKLLRKTMH